MKLPVQLVESFDDCQLNFETLQSVDITFGTVAFTWTASATSADETVAHGIARVPRVFLQSADSSNFVAANVSAATDSTFTANGFTTADTTISGTLNFFWLAIG